MAIETVDAMLEAKLKDEFEDSRDEFDWDDSFAKTQSKLVEIARLARKEIAEGKAQPMNCEPSSTA
jgi:hypothetical protein